MSIAKPHSQWTSKISDWTKVSVEEYRFIFDQAKEKFEDILSENESITNKSIKMATAILAFSGFYLGIAIQNHFFLSYRGWVYALLVVAIINIAVIGVVLFPRKAHSRGITPTALTNDEFDNIEDVGFYLQKLHYQAIGILQDKISETITTNQNRVTWYKLSLIIFSILIISMAVSITFLI